MFKKILFVFCVLAMLGLTGGSGAATAKNKAPTFDNVFTAPYPGDDQWVGLFGSPTEFQGAFYLSTSSSVGGLVWRSVDGETWTAVTDLAYDGIPYQNNWDTTVFKGKLYVSANSMWPPDPAYPGVIFRSANGIDWEQIPIDTGNTNLDKLGEFNGMLYTTSVNGTDPESSGGQIWRSSSGDAGTWTVVKQLEPGAQSSASPVAFKDKIYISGYAGDIHNVIIWSSSDGLNWDTQYLQITEVANYWIRDGMLTVYNGDLYLATINWDDGGAIYRTHDGINWEKVFQISTMNSIYICCVEDLIAYEGDLYAATAFWDDNVGNLGEQIWRSHNGDPGSWEQITIDADWMSRMPERGAFGIFKGQLYVLDSQGAYPGLYHMIGK